MQFGSGSAVRTVERKEGGGGREGAVVLPAGATTCFADEAALIGTAAHLSAMTIWPGEG